jgi:hypothetical protein
MQADGRFGEAMDYDSEGFTSNWHWLLHPGASDATKQLAQKYQRENDEWM